MSSTVIVVRRQSKRIANRPQSAAIGAVRRSDGQRATLHLKSM